MKFSNIKLLVFALLMMPAAMMAQEEMMDKEEMMEEPKFNISGTADVYFRQNLNLDNLDTDGNPVFQNSAFANLPGFALGMINLIGEYSGKNSGAVVDLVFGPRGTDAVFGSPLYSSTGQTINQLYVWFNAGDNVTFTLGNFNTFLGYEVISPTANFNYSTSYMFSWGPFSHTGLKADFDFGNDFTGMLALMNPTDVTEFNATGDVFFGAQLGYGGAYLNFLAGEEYTQIDLTAGWDISDTYYLGVNATDATWGPDSDGGFLGFALYNQFSLADNFALGLRFEYFQDKLGDTVLVSGLEDTNAIDVTLSANINIGALTLIPEIRLDSASEPIFTDGMSTESSLSTFILGAALGF